MIKLPVLQMLVSRFLRIVFRVALLLSTVSSEGYSQDQSYFQVQNPIDGVEEQRGDLWRPALSLLLPGFDQFLAGQTLVGTTYSGLFILGLNWAVKSDMRVEEFEDSTKFKFASEDEQENFRIHKVIYQESQFANQLVFVASGMSAFHSFRTSLESRRKTGQYKFLPAESEETPLDIALAPFKLDYLVKSTTIIPLAVIASISYLSLQHPPEGYKLSSFDGTDAAYTLGLSFNAGTNEEAIFRGWIMPFAREYTGSYFIANTIQSTLFAAAHLNRTNIPIVQLSLGYYLGWLTKRNNWTLSESIFIHTWWDIFAFATQYSIKKETAALWLPALTLRF